MFVPHINIDWMPFPGSSLYLPVVGILPHQPDMNITLGILDIIVLTYETWRSVNYVENIQN